MRSRGGAVGCALLVCASLAIGSPAAAQAETDLVIRGVGAAHGFGMAMDGVEGQARAGWTHDAILDLFYPGTTDGHAAGTIRVGLESSSSPVVGLPGGGSISDAPRGRPAGPGFPLTIPAGTTVTLQPHEGGVKIATPLGARENPAPARAAQADPEPTPQLLPTPPPAPVLDPTPSPPAKREPAKSKPAPAPTTGSVSPAIWMWGSGDPALVSVASTGRRYRGQIEVKPVNGELAVVNHVDMETYVAGIAEEKGQGWPAAGLESLAIAARSLGAATMSWYDKNQANGYDICATEMCQVYLGYDGEEPAMSRATAATAGVIRTHNGRPILAMYHGNGGGQTESYKRVIDNGTDPHPYLASVKYPFADPSRWRKEMTLTEVADALRAAGTEVPAGLERIEITERGESPRVLRVQLEASGGRTDISGNAFAAALELRSTWFDLGSTKRSRATVTSDVFVAAPANEVALPTQTQGRTTLWGLLAAVAFATTLLAAALHLRRRDRVERL